MFSCQISEHTTSHRVSLSSYSGGWALSFLSPFSNSPFSRPCPGPAQALKTAELIEFPLRSLPAVCRLGLAPARLLIPATTLDAEVATRQTTQDLRFGKYLGNTGRAANFTVLWFWVFRPQYNLQGHAPLSTHQLSWKIPHASLQPIFRAGLFPQRDYFLPGYTSVFELIV